jgi:hypothetical protein
MQNIVNQKPTDFKVNNIPFFIGTELLPDFISKRIVSLFSLVSDNGADDAENYYVIKVLNAPTVYFRSYYLLGWTGAWIMYIYSAFIMLLYPFLVRRNSKFYITGWTCLVAVVTLNIFSNMWTSAGTVLLWPILANLFTKIKFHRILKVHS